MKASLASLIRVLPPSVRQLCLDADMEGVREIRLRLGQPAELNRGSYADLLEVTVTQGDIDWVVNAATRYSPWTAKSLERGYLTLDGGHRIGVAGEVIPGLSGFRRIDSLCIRLARDVRGIAAPFGALSGSVLILGAPGWGKTTLLRDMARERAKTQTVAVLDERGELFPAGFQRGKRMDVLSNCCKSQGTVMALRTLGPQTLAVDEITESCDTEALLQAANCGVDILATAHATCREDLQSRKIYSRLLDRKVFAYILVLDKKQGISLERMEQ